MKYLIIVFVTFLMLTGSAAFGQAKVGSAGYRFLTMSPSVRANGMGEAGVALVDDYSIFFNPGSIGLLHDKERLRFSFTPGSNKYLSNPDFKLRYWFMSLNLLKGKENGESPFNLTIAAYRATRRLTGSLTTYSYPDERPTEPLQFEDFNRTQNLAIGFGFRRKVEFGLGFGVKWFSYTYKWGTDTEDEFKSHGYDFGALMRFPMEGSLSNDGRSDGMQWKIIPTIALSFNNYSPEIDSIDITGSYYQWPRVYEERPTWPETRRWGMTVAFELHRPTPYGSMKMISVMPVYEIETLVQRVPHPSSWHKRGIEIEALDALCVRFGKLRRDGETRKNTWGLSVNSQGIARLFTNLFISHKGPSQGSLSKFLQERLQVEFSFAKVSQRMYYFTDDSNEYWDTNFYGISISL